MLSMSLSPAAELEHTVTANTEIIRKSGMQLLFIMLYDFFDVLAYGFFYVKKNVLSIL